MSILESIVDNVVKYGFPIFVSYEKTAAALEECGYTVEKAKEKWEYDWDMFWVSGDPNALVKDTLKFWIELKEKIEAGETNEN